MGGNDLLRGGSGNDVRRRGAGGDVQLGGGGGGHLHDGTGLVASHDRAVPILTYHVIATPTSGTPNPDLWVPPSVFASQMNRLATHGYHVVSLWRVWNYWHGGTLPAKPIVVSFDDGFANQYTHAMPILAAHHWAGVLNLAISHFNQPGWGLSPKMVTSMIAHGWELDSHTMTHAYLPSLDAAQRWWQIHQPRVILQRTFGIPVRFFCYPYGAFDTAVITDVRRAGYLAATTTQPGSASPTDNPYALPRYHITATYFPF